MADRKQTPDIISELMAGKKEKASRPVTPKAGKPVRQQTSKPAKQEAVEATTKATFYLTAQATYGLEQAWVKLRGMAGPLHRTEITKSAIVEAAIMQAVGELETEGKDSLLAIYFVEPNPKS